MGSHHERSAFFDILLARCTDYRRTCLTLTAIHPNGKHPTPSRHIQLDDAPALHDAFARLDAANALGWGAYFAVGLRRPGLTRWQRGGVAEVIALPALFVDVDDASTAALERLQNVKPAPSCIVSSGGGYHAYWWLEQPAHDLSQARQCLRMLAAQSGGDSLSVAQSMRLVGSTNTKRGRNHSHCHLIALTDQRHALADFTPLRSRLTFSSHAAERQHHSIWSVEKPDPQLIPLMIRELLRQGYRKRGDWLNGACPFPEHHQHGDQHPSFGFNTRSGYGFCHVCGTLLPQEMCAVLQIRFTRAFSGERR